MTERAEFTPATKRKAMERTGGKCSGLVELKMSCDQPAVEVDHIKRCEIEPDNSLANARPLCRTHHLIKTRMDQAAAAKGRRIRKETKASQAKKQKIYSRNNLTKQARADAASWKERLGR